MRVISGLAKGRNLKFPKKAKRLRPLSDYAKEGLFNVISKHLSESVFLDLFAGTGQVGIEALSRGAKIAFFVDNDKNAVSTIWENLNLTGFSDKAEVFSTDVFKAIKIFDKKNAKFDIIFIGAPYTVPIIEKVMEKLSKSDILNKEGVIIAEHNKTIKLKESYNYLEKYREITYGDTILTFYKGSIENENCGLSR